jgi:hypothetical protein
MFPSTTSQVSVSATTTPFTVAVAWGILIRSLFEGCMKIVMLRFGNFKALYTGERNDDVCSAAFVKCLDEVRSSYPAT